MFTKWRLELKPIKIKTGTMLYPHIIKICDDNILKANVKSRNDFIESAIVHYVNSLNNPNDEFFINETIISVIEAYFNSYNENTTHFFFKLSVELCMIMNVIAAYFEIENTTLETLRIKCIDDVKKSVGNVDLARIFLNQKEISNG